MKCYSKNLKFCLILLLVYFLPLQLTHAGTSAGTIYSYASPEPVIDGYLEPTLWDFSRALNITLYNLEKQGDTMVVTMLSIFDEADGTISFGYIFPDTTENGDIFGMAFKNNVTSDFILDTPEWGFNGYNDMKGFDFDNDEVGDAITGHQEIQAYLDTYSNATSDMIGSDTHDGYGYTLEIQTDLDSGDVNGHDISLTKGDSIEIFLIYMEFSGIFYTQIREADGEFQYCILTVGGLDFFGINIWFIIGSLMASITVITLVSRNKKKKLG